MCLFSATEQQIMSQHRDGCFWRLNQYDNPLQSNLSQCSYTDALELYMRPPMMKKLHNKYSLSNYGQIRKWKHFNGIPSISEEWNGDKSSRTKKETLPASWIWRFLASITKASACHRQTLKGQGGTQSSLQCHHAKYLSNHIANTDPKLCFHSSMMLYF